MRRKIKISKRALVRLYYCDNKSKYEIGRIFHCSFKTILNRMREYGMKPLHRSIIQSTYKKYDFSGNKIEKAYLIGFRLGDLNVYQTSTHSLVVVVRTNTTRMAQVKLMQSLFSRYGHVTVTKNLKRATFGINCFLNSSFKFLLTKHGRVPNWITRSKSYAVALAAGYIDAEGNIGIYDGRARIKVDSYDRDIILWLFRIFKSNGILCPKPRRIAFGFKYGQQHNKPLWRIRISHVKSILRFSNTVGRYMQHSLQIKNLSKCLSNIHERSQ